MNTTCPVCESPVVAENFNYYPRPVEHMTRAEFGGDLAAASGKAVMHPLVQGVIDEHLGDVGAVSDDPVGYALHKIAAYAAQVARAHALGFEPHLLPDEELVHQGVLDPRD